MTALVDKFPESWRCNAGKEKIEEKEAQDLAERTHPSPPLGMNHGLPPRLAGEPSPARSIDFQMARYRCADTCQRKSLSNDSAVLTVSR